MYLNNRKGTGVLLFIIVFVLNQCKPKQFENAVVAQPKQDTLFYSQEFNHYTKNYPNTIIIDTVITDSDGQSIHFSLSHQCKFDSAISIPKEYNGLPFVTHSFSSNIQISHNNIQTVNLNLDKSAFDKLLPKELVDYGVLLLPYFWKYDLDKREFYIGYSITIPVTDIGTSVILVVDESGAITVTPP